MAPSDLVPQPPEAPAAPTAPPWTDDRKQMLARLWAQTSPVLSTAQIGRIMGISKNSVIGKAHRLCLSPRSSPIKLSGPAEGGQRPLAVPSPVAGNPHAWATPVTPLVQLKPQPAPKATKPEVPPEAPHAAKQPARAQEGCRWVEGDTRGVWRYCDAPRSAIGGSWCAYHRAIVFRPMKEAG